MLSGFMVTAQSSFNDLNIAKKLIKVDSSKIYNIFENYNIKYWVVNKTKNNIEVFIQYNNSVRLWIIKLGDINYKYNDKVFTQNKNVVIEIFIRYRYSNFNDLKQLNSYKTPNNEEFVYFEKNLGSRIASFKIMVETLMQR